MKLPSRLLLIGAAVALFGGCATTTAPTSPADPFEPWNRAMYDVHQVVDGKIVKPVAQAYVDYTPKPIQQTVSNFFGNIEDAFSALTALMSGKLDRAGNDMGRVIVNTLFGIGGLIDVASDGGIPKGDWDFGLAFGTWGFQQGPYLFVPLIGPTTVRDGTGLAIRIYLAPVGYIPDVPTRNVLYGIGALNERAEALSAESMIDQAALDRYTFIRRAYLQRRQYLLYEGKVPPDKEEQ
ncbi:MAG TPA: VacJ family lipoprotein [Casimicrobiaceae bacterium]|nr:VacJ family lipoprotein [Casimicrobiaceae bacterium]